MSQRFLFDVDTLDMPGRLRLRYVVIEEVIVEADAEIPSAPVLDEEHPLVGLIRTRFPAPPLKA